MVDLALVGFFFIVMAALVILVHITIGLPMKATKHPNALWQVEEHPREIDHDGPTAYAFYCVHPDEAPQLMEAVYWDDPNFDMKMEEARVTAQLRCQSLNNKLKALK